MADDDDQKVPHFATARPPPGEEDVYSASTVASEASDEILAIIRGESQRALPAAPGVPKNLKIDPKSDPKIELKPDSKPAAKASDLMPTKPPPAAGAPPPDNPASKPAYAKTPLEVPVTSLTPTSEPPRSVEIAPDPEAEALARAEAEAKAKAEAEAIAEADAKAEAEAKAEATAVKKTAVQKHDESAPKGAMHPAVGIVLFFVAVLAVLAALIR